MKKAINNAILEDNLLAWYDEHQRALPWRAVPGCKPNPYHVWLSEIMLQQTTVATVQDYFCRFVVRWPTIDDLAKVSLDDVFHLWQGLGYYSRARNLHLCAQHLIEEFKGIIPKDERTLLTLPGIGPYTASAIASIAYDQPTIPVDGNVVRVFSRLFALKSPLPALKNEIMSLAQKMVPSQRSGDFAQSLMDLGATICRPRRPTCDICPVQTICKGYQEGIADQLPQPAVKQAKPQRYGIVFWIENEEKQILLEKRPAKGLLAGLMGLPTTPWQEMPWSEDEVLKHAPSGVVQGHLLPVIVRHTFTHFHLSLTIMIGQGGAKLPGIWSALEDLRNYALPTVMKKVVRVVNNS